MTTDVDGNYRGVYTYGNGERISEEDLGKVEGVPNNPFYYLSDALGSTKAITNRNAEIIDQNRFAPYGEAISPVAKNARLTNSPWGYTGESHDIEGGLLYLRNRYYEPETGRFIQQDSYPYFGEVKNPIARNLYAYGNDNPLLYTDPSGHMNYIKQSDDLLRGVAKGAGSWVKDIITTPRAIYDLAKLIISGKISIKKLAKSVGKGIFEDYRYVIKHKSVLNPTKRASNKSVKKFGYHMGKITLDIVSAIVGGKLVSSFSKTKTGQKLIRKFKKIKKVKKEKIRNKGASNARTLSNVEARTWYLQQESKIPSMIDKNLSLEQQAKQAFNLRNQFRTQARELMSDRELAASLNKTDPNLTWGQVIKKYSDKGYTGDSLYREIINSSQRSRTSVNESLGLK